MSTEEKQVDEQVKDEFGTDADLLEDQDAASSDLAADALAEAEESSGESAEKPEDQVPLSKYMGQKTQAREDREARHAAELETAELKGRMAGMQERQVTEAELSPVQARMKEQGVTDEAELDLTTGETMKLMRLENKWDAVKTAKTTAVDAETTRKTEVASQQQAADDADHGEGLDFKTIQKTGYDLLTEGEKLDINKSDKPFDLAYGLMVRAISERGSDSTKKTLQENLARKTKESVEDDPKKPDKPSEDETDDEETEHISNPRLAALAKETVGGGTNA